MDEGIITVPTVQYGAHEASISGSPYCEIPTIYTYAFYFQLFFKMIKFISLVGTLIQTRIGVGTVWSHSCRVNLSSLWQTHDILYVFYFQLLLWVPLQLIVFK